MWFEKPPAGPDWKVAMRHLRKADPVMGRVIEKVGPCTLHPRRDYFVVLCKAIFTQQISTAVATVLFGRFRDLFPRRRSSYSTSFPMATAKHCAAAACRARSRPTCWTCRAISSTGGSRRAGWGG